MASQDEEKAPAKLLRHSLRDSAGPCPEPEILAAYFERSLDRDETRRYELHLSQCARCRDQLTAMHRANPAPAGATEPRQSLQGAWIWNWRLLAPALAALVIAAVWTARRPSWKPLSARSAPPLVALSPPSEPPAAPLPSPAPEQFSNSVPSIPNKTLVAPSAGVAGKMKQSPALTESPAASNEKELASNQPLLAEGRNEVDDLKLKKDENHRALTGDSEDSARGVASGVAPSRVVVPAVPAAAPEPAGADGGGVGGLISNQEVAANTSEATRAKPSGSPTGVRTLTQQAQTQAIVQSHALALEAVDRRVTGIIIKTPDPKVMWRIAEAGFVQRTTDGGASWLGQQLDPNAELTAGSAPSANVCWFTASNGVILLTKDAQHWKTIPPPVAADFTEIGALNDSSATVTTADGRKFTTTDGGRHWRPVE